MQSYNDGSDKRYILEVDITYLKNLQKIYSDLLLLPEIIKIGKCKKLFYKMYNK